MLVLAGASQANGGTIVLGFSSAQTVQRSHIPGFRGGPTQITDWVQYSASAPFISGFSQNVVFDTTWDEYRAGMEFDLSVLSGNLSISQVLLNVSGETSSNSSLHMLAGFAGDGTGSFTYSTAPGAELTAVPFDASVSSSTSIDVTSFVTGLIASDEQYAGFTLDSAESIGPMNIMSWSDFSLTVVFEAASPFGDPEAALVPLPPAGGIAIVGLLGLVAMRRRYLA